MPSDTLIYDLQFRLRCRHCNRRDGFDIGILDTRYQGNSAQPRVERFIVSKEGRAGAVAPAGDPARPARVPLVALGPASGRRRRLGGLRGVLRRLAIGGNCRRKQDDRLGRAVGVQATRGRLERLERGWSSDRGQAGRNRDQQTVRYVT